MSRKLVQDHGGDLTFTSRPGEGTAFRVFLPIADCGVRIAESENLAAEADV